jgi:hypothetical protein
VFCNHCGGPIGTGQQFCTSCGKPLGTDPGAAPLSSSPGRLENHVPILGTLWIVASGVLLLGALAILAAANLILPSTALPPEAGFVVLLLNTIGGILLVPPALGIGAGWGLIARKRWARVLAIVLGFLVLFFFPIGTALGVYTLVILLPGEAAAEWERIAAT